MKILIPPSEGKAKVKPTKTLFSEINFRFEREVSQVVRLLELIDDEDLRSVYGTSAEILDQGMRDKISPGRISVKDWIKVIKTAHKIGIRSTSTMMYGHVESYVDRANHIGIIRKIQKETGGFTEFVPLNFIHTEAPMYKHGLHKGIQPGADSDDIM